MTAPVQKGQSEDEGLKLGPGLSRTVRFHSGNISQNDFERQGEALEGIALHRFNSAMHAKTRPTFVERLAGSLDAYRNARACFSKLEAKGRGRFLRCLSMEAYVSYWLAKNPAKKKRLLEESWKASRKSLQYFEAIGQGMDYAQTYYQTATAVGISYDYDWSLKTRVRKLAQAAECGKNAVQMLQSHGDKGTLAKVLAKTALFLDCLSDHSSDPEKARENQREALRFWQKALRTSRIDAILETSHPPNGFSRILDQEQTEEICNEALKTGKGRLDNLASGMLKGRLAFFTFWKAYGNIDPATFAKLSNKALHLAEEAAKHYDSVNFTTPIAGVLWIHSPYSEHFLQLGDFESDNDRALRLLEKSLRASPELVKLARRSAYPNIIHYALHVAGKAATHLAVLEADRRRKKALLYKALRQVIEAAHISERILPRVSWNRGIAFQAASTIQAKLYDLEEDPKYRKELLLKAVRNHEEALKSLDAYLQSLERPERHLLRSPLGNIHRGYGNLLLELHEITRDEELIRKAGLEFSKAADLVGSISQYDKQAECYWKAAETYDRRQAYSLAAEHFGLASKAYANMGHQSSQLRELANDYAEYMMAWKEVERSRLSHLKSDYDSAAKSYYTAVRWLKRSKRWRFLASYYLAWAKLETGEMHSRNGKPMEAKHFFQEAAAAFLESRIAFKDQLGLIQKEDERTMLTQLANAPREIYCQSRIILEDALVADDQGDYKGSIEKFGLASEKFAEVSTSFESEEDRREARFLSTLCKAWQFSSCSEIENSIKPLEQALGLFARARKMGLGESATKLATGHEAFCRAMIASRKFADSLDPVFREEASTQLDLAARYYLESGFKTASQRAAARKLLLNAFYRLNDALTEEDHVKKTELYRMAGALLRESIRAFRRAHQPGKSEQARKILERAKVESANASHLAGILGVTLGTPTNVAFHTPAQGDERAVGLDRFEHGDIEVQLAKVVKATVEDGLEIQIQITNTGRQPIRILKLEEVTSDSEDNGQGLIVESLGLPQNRIASLKTETVRLVLRPKALGLFRLKPRVIFVDESGVQSERVMKPEIVVTSPVMEFLTRSFMEDYGSQRLSLPSCGWRTFMDVVQSVGIPRSHLYGEPRYGRAFGRQLDTLVKSSLVEYRIFPGERGRGGEITKVRILLENEDVKAYLGQLAPHLANSNLLKGPEVDTARNPEIADTIAVSQ
jgi:hypothetical protein